MKEYKLKTQALRSKLTRYALLQDTHARLQDTHARTPGIHTVLWNSTYQFYLRSKVPGMESCACSLFQSQLRSDLIPCYLSFTVPCSRYTYSSKQVQYVFTIPYGGAQWLVLWANYRFLALVLCMGYGVIRFQDGDLFLLAGQPPVMLIAKGEREKGKGWVRRYGMVCITPY